MYDHLRENKLPAILFIFLLILDFREKCFYKYQIRIEEHWMTQEMEWILKQLLLFESVKTTLFTTLSLTTPAESNKHFSLGAEPAWHQKQVKAKEYILAISPFVYICVEE